MKQLTLSMPLIALFFLGGYIYVSGQSLTYPIVDTDVDDFYDNSSMISAPSSGQSFYGQDASYSGNQPSYTDNGDGTVSDNVTGLMWQQEMGDKITYSAAFSTAGAMTLGGHSDWRVPSIKELYSLILFSGRVLGENAMDMFIDTIYFEQPIGAVSLGEREIDAQTWSSTEYAGLTMVGDETVFGVNFVDGRIKGYPKFSPPASSNGATMYFRMVRGNTSYGINNLSDNNDGTISDSSTGLMWQQNDDGITRDWQDALVYAEGLTLNGYSDWRLPNAKELQSIVDYTRCPDVTNSASIDPLFGATSFNDPDGDPGQYGYYWTGSPHKDGPNPYSTAVYIAFGEAQGEMNNNLMDVHGAGSQRSDPKTGSINNYPQYHGPQGDVRYVFNYVRAVRDLGTATGLNDTDKQDFQIYPNPALGLFKCSSDSPIKEISLFSFDGKRVAYLTPMDKLVEVSVAKLPAGVYSATIITNKSYVVKKVVVVK